MNSVHNPIIGIDEDGQPVPKYVSDELRPDVVEQLVKEYHTRFRRLIRRMQKVRGTKQAGAKHVATADADRLAMERLDLQQHFQTLKPAAVELVGYASSLVEHARIRPYERIGLRLRQAELEAAIRTATVVAQGM